MHEHASRERRSVEAEDLNCRLLAVKCLCSAKGLHAYRVSLVVHPFHLSSCFTFGHGGCSLLRDVFINHVKPQCMNVSLVQSHHNDCIWLKEKSALCTGLFVTLPGCLTCSIDFPCSPQEKKNVGIPKLFFISWADVWGPFFRGI